MTRIPEFFFIAPNFLVIYVTFTLLNFFSKRERLADLLWTKAFKDHNEQHNMKLEPFRT